MSEYIFAILSTIIGSTVTWFFARRKNTAEAQGNEIDNVEKALRVYRDMLSDLEKKVDAQNLTIEKQEKEIILLRKEIRELKKNK